MPAHNSTEYFLAQPRLKVRLRTIWYSLDDIASTSVVLTFEVWKSSACVRGKANCFRKYSAPVTNRSDLRGTRDSLKK